MKLSSQKILAGLIGAATVLTLVVGVVTPAAAQTVSSTTTFTRDLTIGSTGADVTALQQWLATKGFFTANATGYFGTITQAALASFQASVGISPASGYFGPITRAYLAANAGVTVSTSGVPGCAAGAMFSSTSGAPCTSTSSVPGCAAGAMFSSTTGASCTTVATTLPAGCTTASGFSATTGQACTATAVTGSGVLTVTQDPSVVTNTNITSYANVPVYGLQLQAQLGSVNVSQLTLGFTDQLSNAYENPGAFITSVSVVDPSTNTVLMNQAVTPANFIVNPNNSSAFYLQLTGFNFAVPANSTKDLVVEVNTSSSIDLNRTLVVKGYNSSSLQYFTGNNIVNYQDVSGISVTSIFTTANNTSVVFGLDASNPVSGTQYVNSSSGAQGVILLAFNAQSSSGSVNLTNASTTIVSSGTAPTAVYLYNGSTELAAVSPSSSASSTSITFNNFSDTVTSGATKVFTIRADFPSNTANGTIATTTLNTVTYSTAGGQITSVSPSGIVGNPQTFFGASANFQITGTPTATYIPATYSGATSTISATFPIKVTPEPGQETQPQASDFSVAYGTTLGTATGVAPAGLALSPISPTLATLTTPLSQGSTYTFSLNATLNAATLTHGTYYYFWLTRASTTVQTSAGAFLNQQLSTSTIPNNQSSSVYNP